ncbi:MAG: pullulanase-type alpha-1,6-glucosidase [Trueperaceae bacterium]
MKRLIYLCVLLCTTTFAQLPDNVARIHYQRPDGAYEGFTLHVWEDTADEVSWDKGLEIAGEDEYGVYYDVNLKENAAKVGFIIHKGEEKDPGADMFLMLEQHGREVWIKSGDETIYTSPPLEPPAEGTARIHYFRPDGLYDGFELHVWEDAADATRWEDGLDITGTTDYGVFWDVNLKSDAQKLGFILHKGEEKDPNADMFLEPATMGNEVWILSGNETIYSERPDIATASSSDLSKAKAHWVTPDLILWDVGTVVLGTTFALHVSPDASLELTDAGMSEGETLPLELYEGEIPERVLSKFPHLEGYTALALREGDAAEAKGLLKNQLAVSMTTGDKVIDATSLQVPGVLDELYVGETVETDGDLTAYVSGAESASLGVAWGGDVPTLSLWAPTAQSVKLHLFDDATNETAGEVLELEEAPITGIWSIRGDATWKNKFYLYEVTVYAPSTGNIETNIVTDPYSLSLSMNSTKSQIVDLADADLKPEGWDTLQKPGITPEDITVYELHMRDFSVSDPTIPEEQRGTYLAFTHPDSRGMKRLRSLANAGLSHLHLLPTFDIATIDEDKTTWQDPGDLTEFPPDSNKQQEAINTIRDQDGFNWGYDPYHYNVPEGSYAVDESRRIVEYRQMVQGLNAIGLRVVTDVVYNHTNSSGQNDKSVLDKIVPGYYHRLNADGAVETSTCCQNTATEHLMMQKLMVDSVVLWAKEYKIDAFRFDLMGHHMVADMQAVRAALDKLTLKADGVDGTGIYIYGEGWNFGEVANNARSVNATQLNLAGTGIGTFSDRLRDAVRGGGPFDSGATLVGNQGFTSGLFYMPNEKASGSLDAQRERLLLAADQIRVGLAGNLADYEFIDRNGESVKGSDVDYNGQPTGYTLDPQEHIVYISKHDNQTFWDFNQYKLPQNTDMATRVRAHNVGMSIVLLSQGVPFFQAGDDLLRSKSFDRNSYNSGDWFNRLDFSYKSNNFGVGVPLASDNKENWQYMRPLLANPALQPKQSDILTAAEFFKTYLQLRQSSKLFRLETAEDIQQRLTFYNTGAEQIPGVIVMRLSDNIEGLDDLDPNNEEIFVMFNPTNKHQTVTVDELGGQNLRLHLHPLLQASSDTVVKRSAFYERNNQLSVPAFTTAVFVAGE